MRRGDDSHEHPPAEYETPDDILRLFERYRTLAHDPVWDLPTDLERPRTEEPHELPALAGR
jgi:hypothetical protein